MVKYFIKIFSDWRTYKYKAYLCVRDGSRKNVYQCFNIGEVYGWEDSAAPCQFRPTFAESYWESSVETVSGGHERGGVSFVLLDFSYESVVADQPAGVPHGVIAGLDHTLDTERQFHEYMAELSGSPKIEVFRGGLFDIDPPCEENIGRLVGDRFCEWYFGTECEMLKGVG